MGTMMGKHSKEYWAKTKDEEFLGIAKAKIAKYYDFLRTSKIQDTWERSFIARYGGDLNRLNGIFDSTAISREGEVGQVSAIKVNHYTNVVKHAINLAMANKTSLSCVATNLDNKSQQQTQIGNQLLEYYLRIKKFNRIARDTVESGCLFGEGWIHAPWMPTKGELYFPEPTEEEIAGTAKKEEKPIYSGDLEVKHFMPQNVIRDVNKRDMDFDWLIIKDYENVYELMANHKDMEDDILAERGSTESSLEDFRLQITSSYTQEDGDEIPIFYFYHNPTEALPNGRLVKFSKNIIYYDGDLPYDTMPILKFVPEKLRESCFGYSPFNDILGIQQAINNMASTLLSNNLTFGKQHIWNKKGDIISKEDIEGGLRFIYSDEMPKGLNLTASAPESYNFLGSLEQWVETLSGISSTIRGNPESNLKSGNALALVVAQAVQFGSDLEEGANALLEDLGSTIIEHLKNFSKTPRVAEIVGKFNQPYIKSFTADDLTDIKRVTVEQTNAMAKTIAGRVEIAGQVMEMPPEKAKIYMSILNTGKLPEEMESHNEMINIKAENEALRRGEEVEVLITENPINHILGHKADLENPENKKDPELVMNITRHIQKHLDVWYGMPPALLQLLGIPPAPPPQANMPPSQAQNIAPLGNEQPGGVPPNMSPDMNVPTPMGEINQKLPGLPNMPQNADMGSQANYEKFQQSLT